MYFILSSRRHDLEEDSMVRWKDSGHHEIIIKQLKLALRKSCSYYRKSVRKKSVYKIVYNIKHREVGNCFVSLYFFL